MLLFPAIVDIASTQFSYTFYFHGVRQGTCSTALTPDSAVLASDSQIGAAGTLTLDLSGGVPTRGSLIPKTGGATRVAVTGQDPLFSPFYPGLLPYLLHQGVGSHGFHEVRCTDLATGKPRSVNVELFRTEVQTVAGNKMRLREWRLESPPTAEAVIWTDEQNEPLYWRVPAQDYEVVRGGFESLRPSAKFDGTVSPARFSVTVEDGVRIPMRDGVELIADVYRPNAPGRFPVILQRTCYDRSEFDAADGAFFAQRGYVYVSQNVRGRGGSTGEFEPTLNEAADGYDSVEWCGGQPWSNGKVGMMGASYNGFCAWTAAVTRPKWLKTMISVVPMPGAPYGSPWCGGAHYVGSILAWFGLLRDPLKVQPYNDDLTAATNALPISSADVVQFGHPVPAYDEFVNADRFNPLVERGAYHERLSNVRIPVLYLDGWLDTVALGTSLNFDTLVANGVPNQKLIWGPWNHFTDRESRDGMTDFTPDAYIDLHTTYLRWFDRWLKGMHNGIDREPAVQQFMLGENRWYASKQWPPKSEHGQRWYLQGDGRLSANKPRASAPSRYVYDPAQWVCTQDFSSNFFFLKGYDARSVCQHPGQLLFDSKPLKRALRLDGRIRARLYAASNAKDTDWAVTLLDLRADGTAVPLQSGFVRARFRSTFRHPQLLTPGTVVAYDIDLWQIGIRIPAGDRLRIVVASTLFPDMDRNLNTGGPIGQGSRMVAAKQAIYHDPAHASYVELPVLSGEPS